MDGVAGVRREVSTALRFPQYFAAASDMMTRVGMGQSYVREVIRWRRWLWVARNGMGAESTHEEMRTKHCP